MGGERVVATVPLPWAGSAMGTSDDAAGTVLNCDRSVLPSAEPLARRSGRRFSLAAEEW